MTTNPFDGLTMEELLILREKHQKKVNALYRELREHRGLLYKLNDAIYHQTLKDKSGLDEYL